MAAVITALKRSKKRYRLNVYLDGVYSFSLTRKLGYELEVGQILSDEQIANLKLKDVEEETYKRAFRLLSRRPRSEFELRTNFKRHKVPSEAQESALYRLRAAGLVDDLAFAETWVENRLAFRPRSALALRIELRKKGVPKETIDEVLEEYDDEHAAYRAARKAARRWKSSNWSEFKHRVGAYLARRGFYYAMISPVVERVWQETTGVREESEVSK